MQSLKGASVAIVSQNPDRLSQAKETLTQYVQPGQKLIAVRADLTDSDESDRALIEAVEKGGREVDVAILCAGLSKPRWFIETTTEQLKHVRWMFTLLILIYFGEPSVIRLSCHCIAHLDVVCTITNFISFASPESDPGTALTIATRRYILDSSVFRPRIV